MWNTFEMLPREGVQILLKVVDIDSGQAHYTDCTRIANRLLAGCGVYNINNSGRAYLLYWTYISDLESTLEGL